MIFLIDIEDLNEDELHTLHEYYSVLSAMAKRDARLTQSHSVEEAESRHKSKLRGRRGPQDRGGTE